MSDLPTPSFAKTGWLCSCLSHVPGPTQATNVLLLGRVLALVVFFAGFEFCVGHLSHSLALRADSAHLLSDGLALAIALIAAWMTRESSMVSEALRTPPHDPRANRPLGSSAFKRTVDGWAALVNAVGLMGMAGLIGWETYCHLQAPPTEVLSLPMLITAVIGLGINLINAKLLHSAGDHDLNVRGAFLHVMADMASSVGVILAAIAVWLWGWTWADSLIGMGVALLIASSALPLIGQSVQQLWLTTPDTQQTPLTSSSKLVGFDALGFCEIGQTDLRNLIQTQASPPACSPPSPTTANDQSAEY